MNASAPVSRSLSHCDGSPSTTRAYSQDPPFVESAMAVPWRRGLMAVLGLIVAAWLIAAAADWVSTPRVQAAPAFANGKAEHYQEKQNKSDETRVYYGVASCKNCHIKGFEDPDSYICRGTEIAIWQMEDKHGLAYKVLADERGERMGKILGWDVKNKKECLTCHSVWFEDKPGVSKAKDFSRDEGVSCVACHGVDVVVLPGKGKVPKLGWVDTHGSQNQQFREAWRALSRTEKDTDWGMTDLWDSAKRTQLCAACHIGNVGQGKVVTHEMYAAGHPPLPSFEVVTFSNQMPRHWQYLLEKDKKIRDLVKFYPSEVDLEHTHLLAIGGLVAFRENMQLLVDQAATKNWPELAHYSCYACHHDLKSQSWRQERGYAGKPGRPPMREWSTALVELGLFHAAGNADAANKLLTDFHGRLKALQKTFDDQPFGQPDAVKAKAEDLIKWIDTQVKQIHDRIALEKGKNSYGPDASAELLARLLELEKWSHPDAKKRLVPDFDSARQMAWAYQTLYLESAAKHDPKLREKLLNDLKKNEAWKVLDDYMHLSFPVGQVKLELSFKLGLERIGEYEPRQFFQRFDAVINKQPKSSK